MWETINNTLNGNNSLIVLIFILLVFLVLTLLVKGNLLNITTKAVKIGGDETERAILRQQIEWTYNYVSGLYGLILSKYPHLDKMKTKYVLERVYDEIVVWITFNHITRSEMYLMVKTEKLKGLVSSMDVNETINSDEFKKQMGIWTKEIINRLVDIREYYNK